MTDISRTSRTESLIAPGRPHIVLVGLPGAGKSTVGALVGERLQRTFLDFDMEIERREGMTIAQIFGERGEVGFRQLERALTAEFAERDSMVLAPGGGWVTDPAVVALIRPPATMIYLRTRPETALHRLGSARGTRPLLNCPDPLGELKALLAAREQSYRSSDVDLDTETLTPQQVTERLIAELEALARRAPLRI